MINVILILIILIILFMNTTVKTHHIYPYSIHVLDNDVSPYIWSQYSNRKKSYHQVNRINKIDNVKRHGYYQSSKNYSRRRSSIY